MGQQITGQAPTPSDSASFLQRDSTLKVIQTGTTSLRVNPSSNASQTFQVTVTHNLGFAPLAFVFVQSGSFTSMLPYTVPYAFTAGSGESLQANNLYIQAASYSTQLVITAYASQSSGSDITYPFTYFLLQNPTL